MTKFWIQAWLSLCVIGLVSQTNAQASPQLSPDESVHIFPTYGVWNKGAWHLNFHGWVFEKEEDSRTRASVRDSLRTLLFNELTPSEQNRFNTRIQWALVDNESGKQLHLTAPVTAISSETESNGFTRFQAPLPSPALNTSKPVKMIWRTEATEDGRVFEGTVYAIPPQGLSVISDIDDTLKKTEVLDSESLMKNTFINEFESLEPGVPLLKDLEKMGAAFHYLSSSPFFLSPILEVFFDRVGIPGGSMHLKPVRLSDSTVLDLFKSSLDFKPPIMSKILSDFPERQFVLVGDAGEMDPDIYARCLQEHPQQIIMVLIRRVRHTASEDERVKNLFPEAVQERIFLFDENTPSDILVQRVAHAWKNRKPPKRRQRTP